MNKQDDTENNFDLNFSMTDLMTSLMVIFILLLVVTLSKISNGGEQKRNSMVEHLRKAVNVKDYQNKKAGFEVIKDPDDPLSFIVNMDETNGLKFQSNKAEIIETSKPNLKKNYDLLLNYVCSPDVKKDIDSIQIIGHTDINPVLSDPKFGNLSLSQDRPLSVLKFGLYHVGVNSNKGKCLQELASINGRGAAEPKRTLEASRRVEFKIRVKSYEQKRNITNILEKKNDQ